MSESKKVRIFNWVMGALFVLLLLVRFYMASRMTEWNRNYESLWPMMSRFCIAPLLRLCTGYTLMFGLFNLLRAKLEMTENLFTKVLRWVMVAVTAVLLLFVLIMTAPLWGFAWPFNIVRLATFYDRFLTGWPWVMLGVYWFLSLNAIRLAELPDEEDDEDDEPLDAGGFGENEV